MGEYFCIHGNQTVADVGVQPNGVSGTGSFELPLLMVLLTVNFNAPKIKKLALHFREIHCRVSPFEGSYIAESRSAGLNIILKSGEVFSNHLVYLEIPLDQARLSFLNRLRNGSDVKLRLDTELVVDELVQIADSGKFPNPEVWGFKQTHIPLQRIQIVIPRSTWAEQVLPNTRFGRIHIIELPVVPISSCADLQKSFAALQQAAKLEKEGHYQEAVGNCRIALESFFETVQEVRALKASWETRLGKATYDWLNRSLIALKGPGNKAVHESPNSFGQLEAQMILAVTTAVVAYAVKMQPDPPA